jgi:PAS domain S-box-containing protein
MEDKKRISFKSPNWVAALIVQIGKNRDRPRYYRYGLPLVFVAIVTIVKLYFSSVLGESNPYVFYFSVVCIALFVGGVAPAIMTVVVCIVTADFFFIGEPYQFDLYPHMLDQSFGFLTESGWIILLTFGIISAYTREWQNQRLFRAMIEKGTEGIVLIDRSGKKLYCSPSISKIIGYTAEEFLETGPLELSHPDERDEIKMRVKELTSRPGESIVYPRRMKHKDGHWIWAEVSMTNLLEDEAVKAIVSNFYDITERTKIEQQKDDFISIASHELKTPLTSLRGSIQLLNKIKENMASPMIPKLIEQADRGITKITMLIEELLNASRISQGQLHLNKKIFVIADLLKSCCHHVHIDEKHELIITGDVNIRINADEDRIEQVIINFVNNAMKYAQRSREIYLIVEKVGKNARISVKDKGPGIAKEKLPHIFDRYYRVDHEGLQYSGLGLGLYINAGIIKRHNGQIGVDSIIGEGSTFWFTLPLDNFEEEIAYTN